MITSEDHKIHGDGDQAAYCAEIVKRSDPDRYFAALFAPADRREGLFALYAFYLELARLREAVSEPMIGAIRLQWWRDTIDALETGQEVPHPIARALAPWFGRGLNAAVCLPLIDAREMDFEEQPFATEGEFDAYLQGTAGALAEAALGLLLHPMPLSPSDRQWAHAGGRIWARLGLLRSAGFWATRRHLVLPQADLIERGIDPEGLFSGKADAKATKALGDYLGDQVALLQTQFERLKAERLPLKARPGLCYLTMIRPLLHRVAKSRQAPLAVPADVAGHERVWRIFWAGLLGRI